MTAPQHTRFLIHPTPIGEVLIVTTDEGVVTLHPLRAPLEDELERLSRVVADQIVARLAVYASSRPIGQ